MFKTALLCLLTLGFAYADDVTDTINQALNNYKEGKLSDAAQNLDYAAQMVRQKKGTELQKFLPAALAGWKAQDSKSEAMGASMFGGMLSAERKYEKDQSIINIKIITDSPMLQSMMMIFSNPMLASSDGGKLQNIKNQKAIVKYNTEDKSGKISIIVANKYLIEIDGETVDQQALIDYASAVDFDTMIKMT
jgi:hypothetical protein